MNTTVRRKNLIVVRAGDASLHSGWIAGPSRDFDLLISYYGERVDCHKSDGDYYEMRRGPKWPCIADLLAERSELIDQYEAFWFPDDDLAATTETLNRMFALFHGFGVALAQPALTRDSYHSWEIVRERPEFVLRYVSFVEIMAPLFDRRALAACLETFGQSQSGWGLDWIWPTVIGRDDKESMAIIDATPVRHTRPVGGNLYANHPGMNPHRDERLLLERYGQLQRGPAGSCQVHSVVARGRGGWGLKLSYWLRGLERRYRRLRARRHGGPSS